MYLSGITLCVSGNTWNEYGKGMHEYGKSDRRDRHAEAMLRIRPFRFAGTDGRVSRRAHPQQADG